MNLRELQHHLGALPLSKATQALTLFGEGVHLPSNCWDGLWVFTFDRQKEVKTYLDLYLALVEQQLWSLAKDLRGEKTPPTLVLLIHWQGRYDLLSVVGLREESVAFKVFKSNIYPQTPP